MCIIICSYTYRDNIESVHGDEIALLRNQYSDEEKKTIENFLQAKKILRQEEAVRELNGRMVQEETDQDSSSGKLAATNKYY